MKKPDSFPAQQQSQPGREYKMIPEPEIIRKSYTGSNKLKGKTALITGGDIKKESFCKSIIEKTVKKFGSLNILVNNAAMQFPQKKIEEIDSDQVHLTFETNIYPFFYTIFSALEHMKKGDCIINTTSVTAYRGTQ
jgi:NADP-dependent 3-hydroxy acid dehydrogenase YdfG